MFVLIFSKHLKIQLRFLSVSYFILKELAIMDTMQKLFKKGSICVNTQMDPPVWTLNYNVIVKS